MVVEPGQREREGSASVEAALPAAALEALAHAAGRAAQRAGLVDALAALAEAAAVVTASDLAVVRTADAGGECFTARAVWASSPALAAELEGSRVALEELAGEETAELEHLPPASRRVAGLAGATAALQLPVSIGGRPVASLELMRAGTPFDEGQRTGARVAAAQISLCLRAFGATDGRFPGTASEPVELAGDALAAGSDQTATAERLARLAVEATGAVAALIWRTEGDPAADPVLVASHGLGEAPVELPHEAKRVSVALEGREAVTFESAPDALPGGAATSAAVLLGRPPLGVLQLLYSARSEPDPSRLATFGVRAAQALRASERSRTLALELERSRALLAVVGQAIAELSLAHTLETAVERIAELLAVDRLAVYLREDGALQPAAGRGLAGPHARVAERLLDLALGPLRGSGILGLDDVQDDPRLRGVREAASEAGIEAATAVPLSVRDEVIGLLVVYVDRGKTLTPNESALLRALAAQLAVAVQNARLHEQAKELSEEREQALSSERQAARQLRALYEVSRSFAQSLSLEATLEALARSVVELLEVDAAVLRVPDERGELLVPAKVHVRDTRVADAIRTILEQPQPLAKLPGRRLFRQGKPLVLDAEAAANLGAAHELLVPFLEKGSTAVVLPVAIPGEVLATLTVLSLDPARPIESETVDLALTIAGQAALAIDNARLYQQQKRFADTMQRSLLPRGHPQLEGLELGDVYASSARVDVGGDVYDYLTLDDGRLAVVLGDVTGHGIDATADMAMAKFVFRSLAREHPEPRDFLEHANEVVVDEVAPGKFVTMAYLTIDPGTGEVACAAAGHPFPRLVSPDGTVRPLAAGGLPLGIESGQRYEEIRDALEPGAAVVLYTDGVIEARRDGELYGEERLDEVLSSRRELPAGEIAEAVLAECRAFGGELSDDCAVVVIKRSS